MNAAPLWTWMNERHATYLRRSAGGPPPWTDDSVLRDYSFTNVFRELDRVTIWIREHWREPLADHPHLWFAMCVARTINWPDTLAELGAPTDGWEPGHAAALLDARQQRGEKVYTGAYMIRAENQRAAPWYHWSKNRYVAEIVLGRVWEAGPPPSWTTLEAAHRYLARFYGWGPFMAYEVVTDLRWTRYLRHAPDVMTWANAGPGALRGLNRLAGRKLTAQVRDPVGEMRALLAIANGHNSPLGEHVPRPLEMRDIEHSLCETDKWLRVRLGEGKPRARFVPALAATGRSVVDEGGGVDGKAVGEFCEEGEADVRQSPALDPADRRLGHAGARGESVLAEAPGFPEFL